ncbi:MAG: type II secretion system F family protein, partial [Pseudomonadota bacterium]|nr:type II secretion system F family protein [Pseudomonadota bacterium]
HPAVFSPIFISIIRVGEESGRLDEAFIRLYHYLSFEKTTRDRVKVAARYPFFVLIAVTVAIGVIVTVVVPPFARIFESLGAPLPLPTRILIGMSDVVINYWYLLGAATAGLVMGARAYLRTESGRYRWDKLKLRLPVIGSIMLRSSLSRFARAFDMSFRSGVPVVQAMTLISRAVDNTYIAERVVEMRNGIERGDPLSRTARTTGLFPPMVLQMLTVGEETGSIDDMMKEVADFYEREVDYDVENLSATIEPLLIVAVGGVVLLMALGVFLPMWDMYGLMSGGG